MAEPFIGEIRSVGFNYAPQGWQFCDGRLLQIAQYDALFALIGTTYGGDGQSTFALPDLRGRVARHRGASDFMGQQDGTERVSLTTATMPLHNHTMSVKADVGTTNLPTGNELAKAPLALGNVYGGGTRTNMSNTMIAPSATTGQPHNNLQPLQVINYIIAVEGIFPPRS